jgi:aquaporin Z
VLTLIHLIIIPVTNTGDQHFVNSARSTGPALFAGGWAIEQLWLFWLAPLAGAILGALDKRLVAESPQAQIARPPYPI